MGHILMENRNGLVVDVQITHASGMAEREAVLATPQRRWQAAHAGHGRAASCPFATVQSPCA
jgi:hypothetical protein